MNGERWKEVSKASPCPACGHDHWCAWTPDGAMLKCERTTQVPAGMVLVKRQGGGGLFRSEGNTASGSPVPANRPRPTKPANAPTEARIVAVYDYRNAAGELLYQKVRYEPKTFRFRRPDGKGGWLWKLDGLPHVLHRLPELLAADKEAWVFAVEGEKDAENLAALGLVATTNPGGAGKWSKLANDSALNGRRVVIIGDRDKAGLAHAQDVAARLQGRAAVVKVIDLPDGEVDGRPVNDVSDWLDSLDSREPEELSAALLGMAEAAPSWEPKADAETDKASVDRQDRERTPSQSEAIVRLALDRYLVRQTDGGEAFAVERSGPNLALMFRGGRHALSTALACNFRRIYGRTPYASALTDALNVLEGVALDEPPEQVALRVARDQDNIVIDLGDPQGRVVVVRPEGWEVLARSPVIFHRTALTGSLPVPERGGSLEDLRRLVNVNENPWPLVRGWLVAALLPAIPHPILMLGGMQGAGKSTAARMLIDLVDPSPAPLRSPPRDLEAWVIAAAGSWMVGLDNLSHIPPWLSDALCRACTGEGWVRRRLYTNCSLSVLGFRRVALLTSIDPGAFRGDLGARLLLVELEDISDGSRRTEAELDAAYGSARPFLLGALLDAVATVLARLPDVSLPTMPRMADFAGVLAADDPTGRALKLYLAQGDLIANEVLDSDSVAVAILGLLAQEGEWKGTAGELLRRIQPNRTPRGWPTSPRAMAGRLKRLIPALKVVGVEVERERTGHERHRQYVFRNHRGSTVRTVRDSKATPAAPRVTCGPPADDADGSARPQPANRPQINADPDEPGGRADGADGSVPLSSSSACPGAITGNLSHADPRTPDAPAPVAARGGDS